MYVDYLTVTPEVLAVERRQLADTGRLTDTLASDLDGLAAELGGTAGANTDTDAETDTAVQNRARALLDRCTAVPDPRSEEPDELDAIRDARPQGPRTVAVDDDSDHCDHLRGAWRGRIAGCLLGKPVETWTRATIHEFLDATDQELDDYLRADVPGSEGFDLDATGGWADRIDGTVRDDDVDFTVAALETLRRAGDGFTSEDLARTWLTELPACALHTAERVAYRNLLDGVDPPGSATHRNPYRELIGAQIRGDCYGYVAPGEPERAAALAHRDARVSHVRNGIYGAMWIAATLAAVPAVDTVREAVAVGLTEVPAGSRLTAAVEQVFEWYDAGVEFETAIDRVHDEWDDADPYEGYHVLPNAQVVAAVLIWGGSDPDADPDFESALARIVAAGFDTDCNAATVGSVLGLALGHDGVPATWTDPLGDRVRTALASRPCPSLDWLVTETAALADRPPRTDPT
jgi:ADP-ribosylglycohydrolase